MKQIIKILLTPFAFTLDLLSLTSTLLLNPNTVISETIFYTSILWKK